MRLEVFGTADSIAVGLDDRSPIRSVEPGAPAGTDPGYRDFIDRFEPAYRAELAAFVATVRSTAARAPARSREARAALARRTRRRPLARRAAARRDRGGG